MTGCGLFVALLVTSTSQGSTENTYDTPIDAVTPVCHAANILGRYTPTRSTTIRIGWQEKGQAEGIGWSATVVHHNGGYRVQKCKFQHVVHA